jgi:hypothetical protein
VVRVSKAAAVIVPPVSFRPTRPPITAPAAPVTAPVA